MIQASMLLQLTPMLLFLMLLLFVMPLYLQLLRGQDAFHSGLTTFPQALGGSSAPEGEEQMSGAAATAPESEKQM